MRQRRKDDGGVGGGGGMGGGGGVMGGGGGSGGAGGCASAGGHGGVGDSARRDGYGSNGGGDQTRSASERTDTAAYADADAETGHLLPRAVKVREGLPVIEEDENDGHWQLTKTDLVSP